MELKRARSVSLTPCVFILLIVPYGIETVPKGFYLTPFLTFNRTLWN